MLADCDFTWTKRAALAGLGVLLGVLFSHRPAPVPPPTPVAPPPKPAEAIPAPQTAPVAPSTPPPPILPPEASKQPPLAVLEPQEVMDFIIENEGLRHRTYQDSQGYRTVGFGLNLDAPGAAALLNSQGIGYRSVYHGRRRLSQEEVELLLAAKVEESMEAARRLLDDYDGQPREAQIAVADMVYNLGPTGFKSLGVVGHLNAGRYQRVISRLKQTTWYQQVGDRAVRVCAMFKAAEPKMACVF